MSMPSLLRRPPRARLYLLIALGFLAFLLTSDVVSRLNERARPRADWGTFITDVRAGRVRTILLDRPIRAYATIVPVAIGVSGMEIDGEELYAVEWPGTRVTDVALGEVTRAVDAAKAEHADDRAFAIRTVGVPDPPASWTETIMTVFMLGIFGLILWQYIPMLRGAGKRISKQSITTKFADVAGIDEAKAEVAETVEFLRHPGRFRGLGARVPRGVLLVGPPGTGKTMLAKAVAGEAGVPFFAVSGSDFVEMYVGLGARRIRGLFDQARMWSPCVVFIDEIDAVGRKRGDQGGHAESEQTLNALLTAMDGIGADLDIVVMAATNRSDVLDPALLRPGRFDRHVHVDLPDVVGRERILAVHLAKSKLEPDIGLTDIARSTPGFSGADLANLANEAAIIAARSSRSAIGRIDIQAARDRVAFGQERRLVMRDDERRRIAVHEAGHAVLQTLIGVDAVHRVTIVPRGRGLGATMLLPDGDRRLHVRGRILERIRVLLGGHAAERTVLGDASTGAADDIRQAVQLARMMVAEHGMDDGGIVMWDDRDGATVDDATRAAVATAAARIVAEQRSEAERMLVERRVALDRIVERLLAAETMDGAEITAMIDAAPVGTTPAPRDLAEPAHPV